MAGHTVFLSINPGAYALTVVIGMAGIGFTLSAILDRTMGWFGLGIAGKGGD